MTRLPFVMVNRPRRGMALPMVIVVLLVLGASFAGGVAIARGERAMDDAGAKGVLAQTWAETGLQRVTGDRTALNALSSSFPVKPDTITSDSLRVTFTGGYYDVTTTPIRKPVGTTIPGLYLLRAHAVVTSRGVAGAPSAEYTVTRLGTWANGTMTVQSALTGINGINWNGGGNGAIDGNDACGGPALPGVAVPTNPGITGSGHNWQNDITGNPAIQYNAATATAAAAVNPIDWNGIVNNGAITPTYTVTCTASACDTSTLPSSAWWTSNPNAYPIIMVNNYTPPSTYVRDFTMPTGRGLLIVKGNLTLSGVATWAGAVLVGGRITSNGNTRIDGATVTGLNAKLGDPTVLTNDLDILNGTKNFYYNSCYVTAAMSAMGRLRVFPATWSNSFKTY